MWNCCFKHALPTNWACRFSHLPSQTTGECWLLILVYCDMPTTAGLFPSHATLPWWNGGGVLRQRSWVIPFLPFIRIISGRAQRLRMAWWKWGGHVQFFHQGCFGCPRGTKQTSEARLFVVYKVSDGDGGEARVKELVQPNLVWRKSIAALITKGWSVHDRSWAWSGVVCFACDHTQLWHSKASSQLHRALLFVYFCLKHKTMPKNG